MAPKRVARTKPIDDLANAAIEAIAYEKAAAPAAGDGQVERTAKKWSAGMAHHFRQRFAKQLRALREKAGLSVRALAEKAEVDHSQLVRLEAGERSCTLETAVNIAGALGVSLGILTDEADHAAKAEIIDARIQVRYEALTSGRLLEGDRLRRVRNLPLRNLQMLADELDRAKPRSAYPQWPSSIVMRHVCEYERACREAERAAFNASGPPARIEMNPR